MKRFFKRVTSILAAIMMLFNILVPSMGVAAGGEFGATTTLRGARGVNTPTHEYDYDDILGPGIEFGITAETFNHTGHFQSNFAVNHFISNGADHIAPSPDLNFADDSSSAPGIIAAADIQGRMNINMKSELGTCLIYVDPLDAGKVSGNNVTNGTPKAFVVKTPRTQIYNGIVKPILDHA